jgi:hypothetical protein
MTSSQTVEAETHQGWRNWAAWQDPRTSTATPPATALNDREALGIDARTSSGDMVTLTGRMRRVWLGLGGDTRGLVALVAKIVEVEADEIGRNRARLARLRPAAPTSTTVHLPKPLRIWH